MEDVTKAEKPFHMIDKTKVPSLKHMKLVMETAGHWHGAFWQLLNKPSGSFKASMNKDDIIKFYSKEFPKQVSARWI